MDGMEQISETITDAKHKKNTQKKQLPNGTDVAGIHKSCAGLLLRFMLECIKVVLPAL